jgi:hypothetical protein
VRQSTAGHIARTICGVALVFGALTVMPPDAPAAGSRYALRWLGDPADSNRTVVEVAGLSAPQQQALERAALSTVEWQNVLAVQASQGDALTDMAVPPMLGRYRVDTGAVRFTPQFPLEPGVTYRAIFRPARLPGASSRDEPIMSVHRPARQPARATTVVTQVLPSAAELPENLLKFYVHFSAPMSRGHIYDHIRLLNEAGQPVELPFLEIDEELWNAELTRLTLFIDPGRIKRGVQPLEEVGPALEAGKRYTLVIHRDWQDGAGQPLKETFEKRFKVTAPVRAALDPARWQIKAPAAGTRDPLIVRFGTPLDAALAVRKINLAGAGGRPLLAAKTLTDHERELRLTPDQPWQRGPHRIVVQNTLEDLAGNNVGKPFEVDLFEGVQRRLTSATVELPFEVR